jgi:hypothetical protein
MTFSHHGKSKMEWTPDKNSSFWKLFELIKIVTTAIGAICFLMWVENRKAAPQYTPGKQQYLL